MLAAVDTGSNLTHISKEAYKSITARGYTGLQLPAEPIIINSVTSEIIAKTKVLLEFKIDGDVFETPFWVTPQLIVPVILGEDFLRENRIVIDFHGKCFRIGQKENNRIYKFISGTISTRLHVAKMDSPVVRSDHSTDVSQPNVPPCKASPSAQQACITDV
jgi:hypothetical protein